MLHRVGYIDHVALMSGGEVALARILPSMEDYVDAHVILGSEGPLAESLRTAGISVEVLPMDPDARDLRKGTVRPGWPAVKGLLATVRYTIGLSRRLRVLRLDLVHTNSLKASLYGGLAGRLAGVPVIWHIRDRIASDYLPVPAVLLVKLAALVLPSGVITNSETTRRTLFGPGSRRRGDAVVIHDSVLAPPVARRTENRPFRFCLLGRLAPWKGQELFIRSFEQAFGHRHDVEAWVTGSAMFGEADYAASLEALTRQLGIEDRVVFRGFKADIWSELAQVDVLIHCSVTAEPFGQVVIEGLAAGIPVIAAAEGGPAEVITHMVDGILVPPGDVTALASAMRTLYHDADLRSRLAKAGTKTAEQFSPQIGAQKTAEVYDRVLESRSARRRSLLQRMPVRHIQGDPHR